MTTEAERRVGRANLVARDDQLKQLFGERFSEALLEDIRGQKDGRAVDADRRLLHRAPLSLVPESTRAAAQPASAVSLLRPALIGFLLVIAGAAALWIARRGQSEVVTPPVFWDESRQYQDWPGPLREEPTGFASGLMAYHGGDGVYSDAVGDSLLSMVDLVGVRTRIGCWYRGIPRCIYFDLADTVNPIPDPRQQWIAYGIVVDYTGDGRPDVRYGIDNASDGSQVLPSGLPLTGETVPQPPPVREEEGAASYGWHERLRMWRTDLATGANQVRACCEDPTLMMAWVHLPSEDREEAAAGNIFVVRQDDERVFHFYVWASVIEDGRVLSTDYAPDSGWIAIAP
jgi:hypothetical protein